MTKYVIAVDFKNEVNYYVRDNGDTWQEIYDPSMATTFKTKKAAKKWYTENTTLAEYMSVAKKTEAVASFALWLASGGIRLERQKVDLSHSRPYNGESPDEILAWRIANTKKEGAAATVRFEDYVTWPDLHSVFNNIFSVGSYSGRGDESRSISFCIFVRKQSKFATFQEELGKILPHVTKEDKEGAKVLDIFDYYCGDGGNTMWLRALPDGTYTVGTRWTYAASGDLETVFNYIREERYYE